TTYVATRPGRSREPTRLAWRRPRRIVLRASRALLRRTRSARGFTMAADLEEDQLVDGGAALKCRQLHVRVEARPRVEAERLGGRRRPLLRVVRRRGAAPARRHADRQGDRLRAEPAYRA